MKLFSLKFCRVTNFTIDMQNYFVTLHAILSPDENILQFRDVVLYGYTMTYRTNQFKFNVQLLN